MHVHTVATDSHQLGTYLWYLHLIDEFYKFSNSVIIKNKSTDFIIKMFLKYWICLFGSPNTVISDSRGEFASKKKLLIFMKTLT